MLAACCGASDGANMSRRFHLPATAFRVVRSAWPPQTELLRTASDPPVGGHGALVSAGRPRGGWLSSRHTLTFNIDTAKQFSAVAVPA